MLIRVLLPCLPPAEAQSIHGIAMLPLIVREDLNDLFSLSDWRGHQHKGVQQMVKVEVLFRPELEGEKIYLSLSVYTLEGGHRLIIRCRCRLYHQLQMMLDPLFIELVTGDLAELSKTLNRSL